jgi:beta-lactamase class A
MMQQLAQRLPRRSWRLKKSIRLWHKEHRRQVRYAIIGFVVFAAILEVVQLAWPSGRLLPFASIQGQAVGGSTIAAAKERLVKDYSKASVVIKTDTKEFPVSFAEAGIRVDPGKSVDEAADYPLWKRLMPFSLLLAGLDDTPMRVTFDDDAINALASKVEAEGHSDAVNATIAAGNGKAELVPATPSKDYPAKQVAAAIRAGKFQPKTQIKLLPQTKPAALTDREAESQLDMAQGIIDEKIVFTLEGKEIEPDKKTKGGWLTFAPDEKAEKLIVGVNADPAKKYLESIQGDAYKAPGTTRIQLIDDREVSRSVGTPGRGVDTGKAVDAISKAMTGDGSVDIELAIADLPATVTYDKKYSNTDTALAALVSQAATAKGGYGVSLMELDGRSANANGNKQFVAASTYKLYVAYAVIKEVEAGRMSWSDTIGSRTVAKCFDDMIVVSDNDCPKAFGSRIGWQAITSMVRAEGVSTRTQLGSSMYTTANDLSYFLYRLEKGNLVSSAGRERLIDAMKRQSYTRAGIPMGTGGTVANKVGIVDGYVHDAAIVYGSHKTYVLVVMSFGGSWGGIADVASQINAAVNK